MTLTTSKIAIVITAAGSSQRIGSGKKKEYLSYKNGTVISCCAKTFLKACKDNYEITDFIITYPFSSNTELKKQQKILAENALLCDEELTVLLNETHICPQFVEGDSTRQKSVFCGLEKVEKNNTEPQIVLIHDGARPFLSEILIQKSIKACFEYGACVPGLTPVDTQKEINNDGFIERHLIRKNLCAVQTPQCFDFEKILLAHKKAREMNQEFTDDTEIYGLFAGKVKVIEGETSNIKITYPRDLEILK